MSAPADLVWAAYDDVGDELPEPQRQLLAALAAREPVVVDRRRAWLDLASARGSLRTRSA